MVETVAEGHRKNENVCEIKKTTVPKRGQHSQKNCEIVDDSAQTRTALVGQPKKHRFAHHSMIQHFQFLPILQTTNSPDHIHQHRTDFPKLINYTQK